MNGWKRKPYNDFHCRDWGKPLITYVKILDLESSLHNIQQCQPSATPSY
jgi:hypothetical protein